MTTDNASHDARQLTAGEQLRQAREQAGLSVAEVANKQHLRPAVITAIENGDYQKIDSELFLKGYVRAYAAHVGIDANSIVRQLDRELEPLREEKKAQVEANPLVSIERRKRRKKRIARIVVVLLALVAVFYAGSLYLTSQQEAGTAVEEGEADETGEPADGGVPERAEPELFEENPDTSPGESNSPSASALPDNDSGLVDNEGDSMPGLDGDLSGDLTMTEAEPVTNDTTAMDDSLDSGELPATGPEPASGPSDEDTGSPLVSEPLPEPEPALDPAGTRLTATFSDDCWVEVRDADGRTVVAALYRAGEVLDVRGEAPLRVVFGAVNAVASVEFAGEDVDLSSRPARNNRVDLTLTI